MWKRADHSPSVLAVGAVASRSLVSQSSLDDMRSTPSRQKPESWQTHESSGIPNALDRISHSGLLRSPRTFLESKTFEPSASETKYQPAPLQQSKSRALRERDGLFGPGSTIRTTTSVKLRLSFDTVVVILLRSG